MCHFSFIFRLEKISNKLSLEIRRRRTSKVSEIPTDRAQHKAREIRAEPTTASSMESERAYTVGSEFPPLKPGVPRLYSMRFCPYSQRVRLVLSAKKIAHETININSKKRPAWFSSDLNQLGLQINHPCLQIADGHIIHESIIISEYLDSMHPEPSPLLPANAADRATNYMLVDGFQRVAGYLFKVLKFKDAEAFNEIYKILDSYEAYLQQDFFNGKQPGGSNL